MTGIVAASVKIYCWRRTYAARGRALPFSNHNLLLLIVFTGAAVVILLTVTLLSTRTEAFLQTWLVGTVITLIGPFASALYYMDLLPWVGAISFGALTIGFGIYVLAAFQFRTGQLPLAVAAPIIAAGAAAVVAAILAGYDGLSIILWQGWGFACGAIAAANYAAARAEAPVAITVLVFFNLLYALAFGISAVIILLDGRLVLGAPPDNWADSASRLISIVTLLGIGSVLLTLSHRRLAQRRAQPA